MEHFERLRDWYKSQYDSAVQIHIGKCNGLSGYKVEEHAGIERHVLVWMAGNVHRSGHAEQSLYQSAVRPMGPRVVQQ